MIRIGHAWRRAVSAPLRSSRRAWNCSRLLEAPDRITTIMKWNAADLLYACCKLLPSPKLRPSKLATKFVRDYLRALGELRQQKRDWRIFRELHFNAGEHPAEYRDYECAFAAECIG